MEKLKCSNCGGDMEVDSSNKYATCQYCGSKYKLDKDINVNINFDDGIKTTFNNSKQHFKKIVFIMSLPFIIVFGLIVFMSFFYIDTSHKILDNSLEFIDENRDIDFEVRRFNAGF